MNHDLKLRLAHAFDKSFEQVPDTERSVKENLLVIRLGGQRFGLRCSEISAVIREPKITALPGGLSSLLGLLGHQGRLVPVLCLAHWLELTSLDGPKWLALVQVPDGTQLSLAFEPGIEHLWVDPQDFVQETHAGGISGFLNQATPLPIISVPSIIDRLSQMSSDGATT